MSALDWFKNLFKKAQPLEKGMYQYRTPPDATDRFRLHLRVEEDGTGILVINAAKVLHLNQTATEMAKLITEDIPPDEAAQIIGRRYRVDHKQALADYEDLREKIFVLGRTDEICPITYLDVQRIDPFKTPASAPYRMDFALTYACNNKCGHCYVGRPADFPRLSLE